MDEGTIDKKISSNRIVKSKARRHSATSGPKTLSVMAEQSVGAEKFILGTLCCSGFYG